MNRKLSPQKQAESGAKPGPRQSFSSLHRRVEACDRCDRLRTYCFDIARVKKREFRADEYWGKPVPGFGDPEARIWIVGLAPAAHGANRTGRVFTGDSSGRWLFRALHKAGFSNLEQSTHRTDGLVLKDVYISAAARCAPPDNKPLPEELVNCAPFVDEEFRLLKKKRLFLALGSIAFNTILKLLERQGVKIPKPRPAFGHGAYYDLGELALLCSYHPSRQNTQTGKLTEPMWDAIFMEARQRIRLEALEAKRGDSSTAKSGWGCCAIIDASAECRCRREPD